MSAFPEYFIRRFADYRGIDGFFPLGVGTEQRSVTEIVDQSRNAASELMNPAYRPSAEKFTAIWAPGDGEAVPDVVVGIGGPQPPQMKSAGDALINLAHIGVGEHLSLIHI